MPTSFSSSSATFGDRVAFAGRTIVGRAGNSPALDASSGSWEALHGVAGLSGVTMVSIGLAYVLPILAGVAHKRAVGVYVHSLGNSVDDMRRLGRSTPGGGQFELHLIALTPLIAAAAERHRSYPVLHYFHSTDRHAALAPAIAKIALLISDGLDVRDVDQTVTGPLARSVHDLFGALSRMGLVDYAHRRGLDVDAGHIGVEALEHSNYQLPSPAWLEAYVTFDGWEWAEVADGDEQLSPAPSGH